MNKEIDLSVGPKLLTIYAINKITKFFLPQIFLFKTKTCWR